MNENLLHIRTFHPDGNTRTQLENYLEKCMGGKMRIPSMDVMRNGMLIRAPGDKIYKNPEYSSDFFKHGGLIPGSSNSFNYDKKSVSKTSNNFYETLDLQVKTLNPDKIWKNKVRKEELDFDNQYVKTIGNWDNTVLKEYLPVVSEKDKKAQAAQNSQRGPKKGTPTGNLINKNNKSGGGKK
jgi:hypothetical protein